MDQHTIDHIKGYCKCDEGGIEMTKATWPVLECPDCDGAGTTGTAPNGKKYSCETCGGNEDSAGRGWIECMDLTAAIAQRDALKEALEDCMQTIEGLVDQQAMPDGSWRPTMDMARAALALTKGE